MWTLAVVWGASYLFIKLGLEDFEPVFLVFARLVLGAAVLVALASRWGALAPLRGRLPQVAALVAMQVAIPFVLLTYGEDRIASSLTGILVAASPIWYLRRHFLGLPSVGIAAGSMAASALMVAPLALLQLPLAVPSVKAAGAVFLLGVLGTGLAFLTFYTLIAGVGEAKAAVVAYLAPGFAVFYGAVFLDEPITSGAIGGLVLILGGSWLAAEGRAPWHPRPAAPEPVAA